MINLSSQDEKLINKLLAEKLNSNVLIKEKIEYLQRKEFESTEEEIQEFVDNLLKVAKAELK